MATAVDPVRPEPITCPLVSTPAVAIPAVAIKAKPRYHWTRWAWAIGLIVALAAAGELWRMHSQNAVVDVQVGSQVSGNIKALYADFNTKVTKGQLVALIDPAVFQTQVDQAQAALGSAQSAVMAAAAQVQKANSDLSG